MFSFDKDYFSEVHLVMKRSNIIWHFGRGFIQTVRAPSYGEGWSNRHI